MSQAADDARGGRAGRVPAHTGELGQARDVDLPRRRRRRLRHPARRATAPCAPPAPTGPIPYDVLGINLTAAMTFLLICSSVTMVKALEWLGKGDRARCQMFLFFTALGGAIFVSLQAYEWTHLIHRGLHINGNPWGASLFGTSFFLITGFHGLHVTGGVIYLLAIIRVVSRPARSGGQLQRRRDRRALLALRRPRLDHGVHLHVPALGGRCGSMAATTGGRTSIRTTWRSSGGWPSSP